MWAGWFDPCTSWVRRSKRLVYLLYCWGNGLRVEMDATETHTHTQTHTVSPVSISIQTGCAALAGESPERSRQLNKHLSETLQQKHSIGRGFNTTHWTSKCSSVYSIRGSFQNVMCSPVFQLDFAQVVHFNHLEK